SDLTQVFGQFRPQYTDQPAVGHVTVGEKPSLVQNHIESLRKSLFTTENGRVRVPVAALTGLSPTGAYLYEFFQPYGFTDWLALERLLEGARGTQLISPTHVLLKDRDYLFLKEETPADLNCYELNLEVSRPRAPITLEISRVSELGEVSRNVLYVDRETLKKGLQVRKWRKGDYFYPLGMDGRQKVSKYFKDHKFNRFEKEAQWLLCSGEEVVWIIGHRPDRRFKVGEDTTEILKIEWKDSEEV
ncbi:MAG: tRNA lysidine(34) synthetase TilS, partial [Robiginitalea sp.]|nr:tRNA lysidine(34) synthetase TilS [Robiginitalea sp.]